MDNGKTFPLEKFWVERKPSPEYLEAKRIHDAKKSKSPQKFYSPNNLIDFAQGTSVSLKDSYNAPPPRQISPPRRSLTLEEIYMQKLEREEIIGNPHNHGPDNKQWVLHPPASHKERQSKNQTHQSYNYERNPSQTQQNSESEVLITLTINFPLYF